MLSLATVVATLLRLRARACVVLACLAAMLFTASIAPAQPVVHAQTRVWGFESAAPLHIWLESAVSPRTHLENQSSSLEHASGSPHAARGASALSKAGQVLDRGGLTKAGRALEKHGSRSGSVFPKATGKVGAKNTQGQAALDDILGTYPKRVRISTEGRTTSVEVEAVVPASTRTAT